MATVKKAADTYSMEELCVSFLSRNRFYACILSKINKVEDAKIKAAGVGFSEKGKLIMFYNPEFFNCLSLSQSQSVIEHEILHIFWQHLIRLPKDKNDKTGLNDLKNIACDMAINQYLSDLPKDIKNDKGEVIFPGAVYPSSYGLPNDMDAEWYLEELKKKQQDKPQGGGEGEGAGKTLDNHERWGTATDKDGNESDAEENGNCDMEHEVGKIIRQAAKECEGDKAIGELPAAIRKQLENLRNPKKRHDWKRELKVFVNTVLTLSKKLSQKRVNRRFIEAVDYILPGKKKDRKPKLMLARDTSGSVFCDEMQNQFLTEMINISKFCDVLVCDCDSKVHQTYKVKSVKDFREYEGGGGTSFIPVFEEAKKEGVDGIIYLTDTEGTFPNKGEIGKFASKTIWVTINQKSVRVPFGKHVNIIPEENE